jgi:hypothetical protein
MAISVFVVAVSSVGIRRPIRLRIARTTLAGLVSDTTPYFKHRSPFSFKHCGFSFFSKAAVCKDERKMRKVYFENLDGRLQIGRQQSKDLNVGHLQRRRVVGVK